MILEKSFVLFVVFSISHDIIKNKRTYVLKEKRRRDGDLSDSERKDII